MFADYYKQHDKFEADKRDGYQTVGDIAYRDDEGYLYICDRKKDMIISGGMNIYPAEIEAALEQHPDIYDAAVFGIPSEEWGESVHAVVVVRPEAPRSTEADVIAHAREHLASYKVPRCDLVHGRAAQDRVGQDPQARAARAVLGGPSVTGRLTLSSEIRAAASWPHAASISVPRLARTVAFTPRSRRRSRNEITPDRGVPGVGQPGVGLSGMRFTWALSGRASAASSLASLRRSLTPSMSAHSNDSRRLRAAIQTWHAATTSSRG